MCFNFGNIVLPSTLNKLDGSSFYNTHFDSLSFRSVSKLTYLVGFEWFNATTFTVPNSITSISNYAFLDATVFNFLFEKGSTLSSVNYGSFSRLRCDKITFPDSVTTIGQYAFEGATFKEIHFGELCSVISMNAFIGCTNLISITVSPSNQYFSSTGTTLTNKNGSCILFIPSSSTQVTISKEVTEIGQTMLQECKQLKTIDVAPDSEIWETENGVLYKKVFETLFAICGGITEVVSHANVKKINSYAAYGCTNLVNFTFGGNLVEYIGGNAFAKSKITSFVLPNGLNYLGFGVFDNVTTLKDFTMPVDIPLSEIRGNTFHFCGLKSITIGKNVSKIQGGAFSSSDLESVTFPEDSVLDFIGSYAFEQSNIKSVVIPGTLKSHSDRIFQACSKLETVEFKNPSQLKSITVISFARCPRLWKVILPDSCEKLEEKVFQDCPNLVSVTHNLKTIGNTAFENCYSLQTFNLSARQELSTLNTGIFNNCYRLTSFTISELNPELIVKNGIVYSKDEKILCVFPPGREIAKILPKTEEFADSAFSRSPCLRNVGFYSGSQLRTIGYNVFYECKKLTYMQFPSNLHIIKSNSFFGCESLRSIVFPPSLVTIEVNAFNGCNSLKRIAYCGTNEISGTNVFSVKIDVYVTDLYPSKYFCSLKAMSILEVDCELKRKEQKTCQYFRYNRRLSTILLVL